VAFTSETFSCEDVHTVMWFYYEERTSHIEIYWQLLEMLANRIIRRICIRKWCKEVGNDFALVSTMHEGCM